MSDFESYFKSLSDSDKEVRVFHLSDAHTPLTHETALAIQDGNEGSADRGGKLPPFVTSVSLTTLTRQRKVKTAARKATNAP